MKIRNGFVSNSSSSSFIVVFNKKPRSAKEVKQYMFGNDEADIKYSDYTLSIQKASERVFNDISKIKEKMTLKSLTDALSYRYYYSDYDGWGQRRFSKYFGSNSKLLCQLRDLQLEQRQNDNEFWKKTVAIEKACPFPQVPFATKNGNNYQTKKPYSKKAIKAYEEWEIKHKSYLDNHEEYQALLKRHNAMQKIYWQKTRELDEQIAKEDAELFLKDNKGKFIFEVTYSDNGNGIDEVVMEHGNIFQRVTHITISKH